MIGNGIDYVREIKEYSQVRYDEPSYKNTVLEIN